jgi:hypothetical protein
VILALAVAHASPCCTSMGAQPTTLASCDAVAIAVGVGGDVETGGWSWSGDWAGAGDDGGGDVFASLAVMGRVAPWLQLGARAPVVLAVERLDGASTLTPGVGDALVWADVQTAWKHPSILAFEVGVGSQGPGSTSPGAVVVQAGGRASVDIDAWRVWGDVMARVPVYGAGVPEGEVGVVLDRGVGSSRIGLGVGAEMTTGKVPTYSARIGPSWVFSPTQSDRLLVVLQAGLPVSGLGRNAPSRVALAIDWYHVVVRTPIKRKP